MFKTIAIAILTLALGGAGYFAFTQKSAYGNASKEVAALEEKIKEAEKKEEEAAEELKSTEEALQAIPPLEAKVKELEAVKSAFASGAILKDLEALYAKDKKLSTEKQLGLAGIRMLTHGGKDPSTIEAFNKALEMTDWKGQQKVVCAAQKALLASGEKVKVMSECAADAPADKGGKEAKKDDGSCKFAPTLVVNGNNPETINVGDAYTDAGATATNTDGTAATVTTTGQVDANTKGTYTLTYTATNDNGTSTATRTVNVVIGMNNWLVNWEVSSDCGTSFPLATAPVFATGTAGTNDLLIDNMFNIVGGTATATVNGSAINIPTQTIDFTFGQVTFSGVGTINDQANTITITYTYDNTTPIIGGSGTCVATYTKI